MATMIPYLTGSSETLDKHPVFKDAPGKQGEIAFYIFARDCLPEEWIVIYNQYMDGHQIDFYVIIPKKGILNVDAKGNGYSWHDGCFYLGNERRDLFGTADKAIHEFDALIKTVLGLGPKEPWGAFGRCLMFMLQDFSGCDKINDDIGNCNDLKGIRPSDRIPGGYPYLTLRDFCNNRSYDKDAVIKKFNQELDKFAQFDNVRNAFEKYGQKIIDYLTEGRRDENRAKLFKVIENDGHLEKLFLRFTEEQKDLIKKITSDENGDKYLHIQGCAGSGKTLLAMYAANYFSDKRVLYVCYNKNLADSVKFHHPGLTVCTIDQIHALLERALASKKNTEDFRRKILEDIMRTPPNQEQKFDVIIMDEAQDMDSTCFKILFLLLPPNGKFRKFIVFSDDQQGIFTKKQDDSSEKIELEKIQKCFVHLPELKLNLRNAENIFKKDQEIHKNDSICVQTDPRGKVCTVGKNIMDLLESLRKEGFAPCNIAILAFSGNDLTAVALNMSYKHGEEYAQWQSEQNKNWNQNSYIWCGCVQGFKGLEADCLILVGNIPKNILGHTAITRSKLELHIMENQC